jgi:hypothetical protein
MRKRIITAQLETDSSEHVWLNLEELVEVEVSSEDPAQPIENALLPVQNRGWRAAVAGEQIIRLVFDYAQSLRQIRLKFEETQQERTQEFVLRWSADHGQSFREIVRQQWNFNPQGATTEVENLHVELAHVTVLELIIIPDISRGPAHATLEQLRLA